MLKVRIVDSKVIGQKLAGVREVLGYSKNAELFRTIQLSDFQERALQFIRSISPVGKNSDWQKSLGAPPRLKGDMPLRDSWRINRFSTSTYIGFDIRSLLENAGKRGQAKIKSIEYGNKDSFFIAKRKFSFYSEDHGGWVFIPEGTPIDRPSRKGMNLTAKTSTYIETVLLPEIRSKVGSQIRARLERYS